MATGFDLTELSAPDVLDLGILAEEEANQRYREFEAMMHTVHRNPEAARFFAFMAEVELRHRDLLATRRGELFPDAPRTVKASDLFDVEAPGYETATAMMTYRDCLELSLGAEIKAEAFYRAASGRTELSEVTALLEDLAGQEVDHQRLLRERLAALSDPGPISPEDVADEPVGQD